MNVLLNSISEILDILLSYNEDLKNGNLKNVIKEVEPTLLKNQEEIRKKANLTDSPTYGINIEFIGLMSNFLFPSILYANNFRVQIIIELKKFIKNNPTFDEISLFLSKKLFSTIDVKRGGFKRRSLEILRFYLKNYDRVLDNSYHKYERHLPSYKPKYYKITHFDLINQFSLTQKYFTAYPLANYEYFFIPAIFLNYEKININFKDLNGIPLGILYNDLKEKKFLLINITINKMKEFKQNLISKITFFENLDFYYKKKNHQSFQNKVNDIFKLHSDFKSTNFTNTAISYDINYLHKTNILHHENSNLDMLSHLFNIRKIPSDFEIHPLLMNIYSYRNKLVTFYSSTKYFIHIYDPDGKTINRYADLFDILLKNTFSNGYIVHYKTGIFISTNSFKDDFNKVRNEFQEFIWFFKLDLDIFEDLNFIPFITYLILAIILMKQINGSFQFLKIKQLTFILNIY